MARTPRTLAAFAACLAGAGLAGAVIATQAQALETNVGNVDLFIDTTTSAGVAVRTASRQTRFLPEGNGGPQDLRALTGSTADDDVRIAGGGTFSVPSEGAAASGALFVPFQPSPGSGAFRAKVPAAMRADFINEVYDDQRPAENPNNFSGSVNTDDGRLNFDRGDLTGATLKMTNDIEATFQNFVLFSRVTSFYDAVIDSNSYYKRSGLTDGAREDVGRGIELLDFYVGGNFSAGEWPLNLRLGKQVISWGEGTFLFGGINVINPIDITAFRRPGAEIKEGLIPVWAAYGSVGLPYDLSLEGFYQLKWDDFDLDRPGTPFANSDAARVGSAVGGNVGGVAFTNGSKRGGTFRRDCENPGGLLPTQDLRDAFAAAAPVPNDLQFSDRADGCFDLRQVIPSGDNERVRLANGDLAVIHRAMDEEPVDSGQYGAALRWYSEDLGSTEFGLYYVNYHSRLPFTTQRSRSAVGGGTVTISTTSATTNTLTRQLGPAGCGSYVASGEFASPRLYTAQLTTNAQGEVVTDLGAMVTRRNPGFNSMMPVSEDNPVTISVPQGITLFSPETRAIQDARQDDGMRGTGAMPGVRGVAFSDPEEYINALTPVATILGNVLAGAGNSFRGLRVDPSMDYDVIGNPFRGFGNVNRGRPADVPVYDTLGKLAQMNCVFLFAQNPAVATLTPFADPMNPTAAERLGRYQEAVEQLGFAPEIEGGLSNAAPVTRTGTVSLSYNTLNNELFFEYPEDIKMVGVSFNTTVGDWGVQGEMSYRSNQPFSVDGDTTTIGMAVVNCAFGPLGGDVAVGGFEPQNVSQSRCSPASLLGVREIKGYEREKMYTAQVGTTAIFTGSHPISDFLGSDISVLVTEVGGIYVPDVPEPLYVGAANAIAAVAEAGRQWSNICTAGTDLPLGGLLALDYREGCRPDSFSWGYVLLGTAQYNNAFGSAWTISPQIIWSHDVKGNSPSPIGTYREKSKAMSLGVTGTYQSTWRIGLRYTDFFGDELFTRETDRDFASFDVSYSF